MHSFKHYILVIAISLLPFVSIFSSNLAPHTHDSPVHYARIAAYYKALSEGQILPRWAGELNYGYGMPLFNFIYHVPYLVAVLPVAVGSGTVFAFKFSLAVSFVLSGIFMYRFALAFFKDTRRAAMATALYQFAPFHLIDLVVRGDMAEGYALAFLPLVLYTLVSGFERKTVYASVFFTAIATLLLITSHNAISLVFFGIAVLFAVIFAPTNGKRVASGLGLALGLALAAFYWLPALFERRYTYGDLFMKDMYLSHFAPLLHFFIPNFTDAQALQTGGIAVSLGLVPTVAFFAAIFFLVGKRISNKADRRTIGFGLFLSVAALFVMQPVSKILWEFIPILRMFQFPWRLLNVTTFSLSLIGAAIFVTKKTSPKTVGMIVAVAVFSSLVYFRPPLGMDTIDEKYYWDYPLNTTYFGETDIIWSAGPKDSYPEHRFEVVGGNGTITDPVKRGTKHTFTVHAESDVQVVDKTQYFPGWRVYAGTTKVPVEFQDQNWRGLITFRLPAGTHRVTVAWEDSPIRRVAVIITIASGIVCAVLFMLRKKTI
jgi:hypothetical protein